MTDEYDYVPSGKEDEQQGYKAQLSFKFGVSGMINLRAATIAELVEMANELAPVGALLVGTAEEIQGSAISAQAAAVATVTQAFPQTQQVQQQPAYSGGGGGSERYCAHGIPMSYREGVSKAGKPYKAYFCTVKNDPRLGECPAQFIR